MRRTRSDTRKNPTALHGHDRRHVTRGFAAISCDAKEAGGLGLGPERSHPAGQFLAGNAPPLFIWPP
jgi:hypothetical protein